MYICTIARIIMVHIWPFNSNKAFGVFHLGWRETTRVFHCHLDQSKRRNSNNVSISSFSLKQVSELCDVEIIVQDGAV